MDLAAALNAEQIAAVTHGDGPQLVLAGAGSGKTRVITYRVAWLVRERGVDPGSVVAVTFTNKAAAEMRDRVERLLDLFPLPTFVGTFHRYALTLLRRYGERAYGLLNSDIDELVGTTSGTSIYDLAKHSRGGLVAFRGTWIEATHEGSRHRQFTERLADGKAAQSRQRKWALDPSRAWVRNLGVHPYWHWIHGRPPFSKTMPADATYWHFKPISTNWKVKRTAAPMGETIDDAVLRAAFARLPE